MVRKTPFLGAILVFKKLNMKVLPRQAWDKRRKGCEKKGGVFCRHEISESKRGKITGEVLLKVVCRKKRYEGDGLEPEPEVSWKKRLFCDVLPFYCTATHR